MSADTAGIPHTVGLRTIAKKGKLERGIQRHSRKCNKGKSCCGSSCWTEQIEAVIHILGQQSRLPPPCQVRVEASDPGSWAASAMNAHLFWSMMEHGNMAEIIKQLTVPTVW